MPGQHLEAVISARFDQLLGREQLERDIEESAKKAAEAGSRAAQSVVNDVMGNIPKTELSREEIKSFDKIQSAFEASGKVIDEKSAALIKEFEGQKEIGLTQSQWKSYERKFGNLNEEAAEEMRSLEKFIKKEYGNIGDDKVKEYFDAVAGTTSKIDFTKDYTEYLNKSKAYDKVFRFEEETEDFLSDFEKKRKRGMTEAQEVRYDDKFATLKEKIEDYKEKILPKYDLPETEQAKVENSLKQLTENATKSYGLIKTSIEETIATQDSFFKQLQQAGYVAMASGIFNQAGKIAVASASIEAKERTSFDMTSAVGMYTEREQYELFKQNTERSIMSASLGMFIGGGIGLLAGGPIGSAVGGGLGSNVGSMIAEYFNKQAEGEVGERLKLTQQSIQLGTARVEEFKPYEIEATKLSGRFGEDMRGSSDLGYTLPQELEFRKMFATSLKRYEDDLYSEQLTFSRANYLNPEDMLRLNSYTRLTGQEYDTRLLSGAKEVSKEIYGPNADAARMIELLEKIALINTEMLKYSSEADAKDAFKFAGIAEALFGVKNPYGRLGELGMDTIKGVAGLAQPSSDAHEAFLFRAYSEGNGGKLFGPNGYLARLAGGAFYKPEGEESNIDLILNRLEKESFGSKQNAESILWSTLKGKITPEAVDRLSTLAAGGTIISPVHKLDDKGDFVYKTDDKGNFLDEKGKIVKDKKDAAFEFENVEVHGITGFKEQMSKFGERLSASGKSKEEIETLQKEIREQALGAKTIYEDTAETVSKLHKETAELWKAKTQEMILQLEENQSAWLNNSKTIYNSFAEVEKGLEHFLKKLAEQGIYVGEKGAETYFNNEKYEAVFAQTKLKVSDVLNDDEIEDIKKKNGSVLDEYAKRAAQIKYAKGGYDWEGGGEKPAKNYWASPNDDRVKSMLENIKKDWRNLDSEKENIIKGTRSEKRGEETSNEQKLDPIESKLIEWGKKAKEEFDKAKFRERKNNADIQIKKYEKEINEAAEEYNIDGSLIKSIIKNESGGDKKAISEKGAKGLMQLMPSTAKDLGVSDIYDPRENIMGGTKYLAQQVRKYEGDIKKALAAYNAGPGNVDDYIKGTNFYGKNPKFIKNDGVPEFTETKKYVKNVAADFESYKNEDAMKETIGKLASSVDRMERSLSNLADGTINIHFSGLSDRTQNELENATVNKDRL